MSHDDALRAKYGALSGLLDERSFRLCLAGDAMALGHGGISQVARASGVSRTTIHAGMRELRERAAAPSPESASKGRRVRRPGGGRKARPETDATVLEDLDHLLDPVTRGDPMSPLRWTCKSTTKLAGELRARGHVVSQATVWRLLEPGVRDGAPLPGGARTSCLIEQLLCANSFTVAQPSNRRRPASV